MLDSHEKFERLHKGPFIKDISFFVPFFNLTTNPYPIFFSCNDSYSIAIADLL